MATMLLTTGELICSCEMGNDIRTSWSHYPDVDIFIEGLKDLLSCLLTTG